MSSEAYNILGSHLIYEVVAKPEKETLLELFGTPIGQADTISVKIDGPHCSDFKHPHFELLDVRTGVVIKKATGVTSFDFPAEALFLGAIPGLAALSGAASSFARIAVLLLNDSSRVREYILHIHTCSYSPDGNYLTKFFSLPLAIRAYPNDKYKLKIKTKAAYSVAAKKEKLKTGTGSGAGTQIQESSFTVQQQSALLGTSSLSVDSKKALSNEKYLITEKVEIDNESTKGTKTATNKTENTTSGDFISGQSTTTSTEPLEISKDEGAIIKETEFFQVTRNEHDLYRPAKDNSPLDDLFECVNVFLKLLEVVKKIGKPSVAVGWWLDASLTVGEGEISLEWDFAERKTDPLVYLHVKATGSLTILDGTAAIHYGARLAFTLFEVEASVFLELTVSAKVSLPTFERTEPPLVCRAGYEAGSVTGTLGGKVGVDAHAKFSSKGDEIQLFAVIAEAAISGEITGKLTIGGASAFRIDCEAKQNGADIKVSVKLAGMNLASAKWVLLEEDEEGKKLCSWP